jgi:DNA adenine methylase
MKMIADTPVNIDTRRRMKSILMSPLGFDELEIGFATFFLNRTNRSGILNGGAIGGKDQSGLWKIDARYNKNDLLRRIERIALARKRICLTNLDAVEFLCRFSPQWNRRTLVYLDPPYYQKGRDLYYNYYKDHDHRIVANEIKSLKTVSWIVSYDDVLPIQQIYTAKNYLKYIIGYSARNRTNGVESMFFSSNLKIPPVSGSMIEVGRRIYYYTDRTNSICDQLSEAVAQ